MKGFSALKRSVVALALAGLVGCAGGSYERPQVHLADQQNVPKSNWSDALVMFHDQMGIYGMQDATVDSTHPTAAGVVNAAEPMSHGAEMGVIAQSVAVGALFFVLDSGPRHRMINRPQVAFWVPADEASTPEQAGELVAAQWTEIRRKVLNGLREVNPDDSVVSGYPVSHPKAFGSIREELNNQRPPFAEGARQQTAAGKEGTFFGPIFVHMGMTLLRDSGATDLKIPALLEAYGQHLPETAMLYYYGESAPKIYEPAFVMHNQKKHYFRTKL